MELYFSVIAFVVVVRSYGNSLTTKPDSFVEQTQSHSNSANTSAFSSDYKNTNFSSPDSDSNHTRTLFSSISTSDYTINGSSESVTFSQSDSERSCVFEVIDTKNVNFLGNGSMFLPRYNATIHPYKMYLVENHVKKCFITTNTLKEEIFKHCKTFKYNPDEFVHLPNGSIKLYDVILDDEIYKFNKSKLIMCSRDEDLSLDLINLLPKPMDDADLASIYIGNIGCFISIIALLVHFVTFCLVPSLRNLPGYNLVSLGVAFIMAYSFNLIGQIPQVLGRFCVTCAIMQQFFFLAAFFWMNVMSFDVWRTLRMATERLMVSTRSVRRRQFLWYSSYAWLVPLGIVVITVGLDNSKNVSDRFKPLFGRNSICWFTNSDAKGIFFILPAFVLLLSNAVFFVLSARILKNNTMTQTVESEHRQTAKLNLVLYVRLALMMGVTWLLGAIGLIFSTSGFVWLREARLDTVVWFLFDILNSLQGLFVFLLFTCGRKVYRHIQDRISLSTIRTGIDKHMFGDSTKCIRDSTKCDLK